MSEGIDTSPESWQVRVHGRVQGVGFRESCIAEARARQLDGWVRNRSDGSVELLLQASAARLEAMCEWLREGEHPALVDALDVVRMEPPFARLAGFRRLPTL